VTGVPLCRYPSPLRYPGGKGKIANFIKLLLLDNDLLGVDYVEPYAGGASVGLSLLFEDYADHIYVNDLNPGVHAFWHSVLYETDALCQLVETTAVNMQEWQRQRMVQAAPDPTRLALGFSTFFLNRTNRSGIISGGVIGGLEQEGPWTISARYNKPELVRRIRKIARYRTRITLTRLDAVAFLQRWTDASAAPPAFLYLDPPYYVKGEGLYDNFYAHHDHVEVAELVRRLQHPWLVSYDAVAPLMTLYRETASLRYSLAYSAAGSSQGPEVMFYSPGLVIPTTIGNSPSGVHAQQVDRARLHTLLPS
jgi:DNA adenine methylase